MHLSTVDVRTSATVFAATPKLILLTQSLYTSIIISTVVYASVYVSVLTKNDFPGATTFDRSDFGSKQTRIFVPPWSLHVDGEKSVIAKNGFAFIGWLDSLSNCISSKNWYIKYRIDD